MKRTYQRSQILNFSELNEVQQKLAIDLIDLNAVDDSFVLWNNEPLPLSMFMRNKGLFHGTYGLTYYSAYLIRINATNEAATVVYAHW
jgi:hypothetical protein